MSLPVERACSSFPLEKETAKIPNVDSMNAALKNLKFLAEDLKDWETITGNGKDENFSRYPIGYYWKVNTNFKPQDLSDFFENIKTLTNQVGKEIVVKEITEMKALLPAALESLKNVAKTYKYYNCTAMSDEIESVKRKWEKDFNSKPKNIVKKRGGLRQLKRSRSCENLKVPTPVDREFSVDAVISQIRPCLGLTYAEVVSGKKKEVHRIQ